MAVVIKKRLFASMHNYYPRHNFLSPFVQALSAGSRLMAKIVSWTQPVLPRPYAKTEVIAFLWEFFPGTSGPCDSESCCKSGGEYRGGLCISIRKS
jgi:hypothetical protein